MPLELQRPLAFIDLESTGTSPERDRIIEIAILKLRPDGREEFRCKRVNPGIPIPLDATAVHGITDADVAHEPPFLQYARGIHSFLDGCDFAGFGITHFDLPLLRVEFMRTRHIDFRWRQRRVIDAMAIFHDRNPRTLSAAVRIYCERDFPEAHSAKEDVHAARAVLSAQLERHSDLPSSVDELHLLLNQDHSDWVDHDGRLVWVAGAVTFGFGQHKGRLLQDLVAIDPDYLQWMLAGDFPQDTKDILNAALRGDFPADERSSRTQ